MSSHTNDNTIPQPTQEDILAQENILLPWPDPIAPAAIYGLAGQIVTTLEPHTEADPAALLFTLLTLFGNVINRNAHYVTGADKHYQNLFVCLVGTTAKGRKGTSYSQIKQLLADADPDWLASRHTQGASSGEGLIWAVRDEVQEKNRKGVLETIVTAVADKRLLVVESEFASVIRVFGRDGNRLSPVLRQAWDSGDLNTLTKSSPAKATGAHISIVAHITKDELLRYLDNTEVGNGFGNRFLWICCRRSKCLPEGGALAATDLLHMQRQIGTAIQYSRTVSQMYRDDDARSLWAAVYPDLSNGKPGLLGAMTARAEAQVLRLSCIYALLDLSSTVRLEHLQAALAAWDYSARSATYIFGSTLGDPVADECLRALRRAGSAGLTRTEICKHLGNHKDAATINRALAALADHGLALCTSIPTSGRPVARWSLRD